MRRYPLKIHLITLTTLLVTLVGGSIGWLAHDRTTRILHESTTALTDAVSRGVAREIALREDSVRAMLRVIATDAALRTAEFESRAAVIDALAQALRASPQLVSLYVGYGDGDYLLMRHVDGPGDEAVFETLPGTRFVIQHIERGGIEPVSEFIYLDGNLDELGRRQRPEALTFDPRQRPWYRDAQSDDIIATSPYRFFTSGLMGFSLAMRLPDPAAMGIVLGADIRLGDLERELAGLRPTPHARIGLFDADDQLIATTDADQDAAIFVPLLAARAKDGAGLAPVQGNANWFGRVLPIRDAGGGGYQVAILIPEDEMLGDARLLLRDQTLLAGVLLVVGLVAGVMVSRAMARSLQQLAQTAVSIRNFDFIDRPRVQSVIQEVDELSRCLDEMRLTLGRFQEISHRVAQEKDLDRLTGQVLRDTVDIARARSAILFLEEPDGFRAAAALFDGTFKDERGAGSLLQHLERLRVTEALRHGVSVTTDLTAHQAPDAVPSELAGQPHVLTVPLRVRDGTQVGALVLLGGTPFDASRARFIENLSGFVSVSLETRELIRAQKALFDAFVRLIAGAIDAKSPYTGGHCERVPVLTRMLVEAACAATDGPYAEFELTEKDWEAVELASWLHDCGKVTTPEFVVDKATRLETLYDRIHEVRTRFEVLKREVEVAAWQRIAEGGESDAILAELCEQWRALDDDFRFVAECNSGETCISDEHAERLRGIAARTWTRTLDDRLGLGPEEAMRKAGVPLQPLPVEEPLLADRSEHLIPHARPVSYPAELNITLPVPELLYNRGELHNLLVKRGTLTDEERFKINEHIIQTLVMLNELPFPAHLVQVPELAGGHHERMDGKGYPRSLCGADMSPVARMLAIADVYEALTAGDRPYKTAKTREQALRIMGYMAAEGHLDPELFALFKDAGIPERYAQIHTCGQEA